MHDEMQIAQRCPYIGCESSLTFARAGWWRCPQCKKMIYVRELAEGGYHVYRSSDDEAWEHRQPEDVPLAEFNPWHDAGGRFATGGGFAAPDRGGSGSGGRGLVFKPSRESINRAIKIAEAELAAQAKKTGMTPEKLEAQCMQFLKDEMGDPPIVAVRHGADATIAILNDGRMKTQFETGTSGGAFDPEYRTAAEKDGLGYPEDAAPAQRPVYGYVKTKTNGAWNYGAAEFELKPHIKARATVTVSDSLAAFEEGRSVGAPLSTPPGKQCWDHEIRAMSQKRLNGYIEAQIQGGVKVSDVQRIILKRGAFDRGKLTPEYQDVAITAKSKGIEVVLDPDND